MKGQAAERDSRRHVLSNRLASCYEDEGDKNLKKVGFSEWWHSSIDLADDKYWPWIERNCSRARKGGRKGMPKLLPFPRRAWRKCSLKRYIRRMVFSDGCSTKGTQWLYVRRKRNERAPTKIAL
jgi:hypothetical protein